MKRDSIANTFVVAGGLCIVCSLLVSGAAVMLRPAQQRNAELDKKRNILVAAGLIESKASSKEVEDIFKDRIQDIIVDLETGEDVTDEYDSPADFDQLKASKDSNQNTTLTGEEDIAGIKRRENHSHVYIVLGESSQPEGYVFPVRGYGLWSTLYGFLAVKTDMETILGLTFYQHGETPGLGGEVDNPKWKAQWVGKKIYGEPGEDGTRPVDIQVVKGFAAEPNLEYKIDGLSGATITSSGVTSLLQYWLGPEGFRPFITKLQENSGTADTTMVESKGGDNG